MSQVKTIEGVNSYITGEVFLYVIFSFEASYFRVRLFRNKFEAFAAHVCASASPFVQSFFYIVGLSSIPNEFDFV